MKPEMIIQTYGADTSGMVCGFRFASAAEWAAGRDARPGEFLWLHFNLAHGASERWMRAHLDLPETFYEFLREGSHSTRIEQQEGALRAVVNDVMFSLDLEASESATMWAYVDRRMRVTAHAKPLRSLGTLRESVRQGGEWRTGGHLRTAATRQEERNFFLAKCRFRRARPSSA